MGKNSSRRFYRNYNEAAITTSLFLPSDPNSPGIAPIVVTDAAPAGMLTRATYLQPDVIGYPESTPALLLTNARRSFAANGRHSGLLLEQNKLNYIYGAQDFATSGLAINWFAASMSGAGVPNEIGPDGAVSAVTLTAVNSNAVLSLSRGAIGAGTRRFTVWLKRKTGSGNVLIQIVTGGATLNVGPHLSSTEWRRFEITATSGQATCAITISSQGDAVCAYGPGLYLSANGRSSTSLPQSQITSGFTEYIQSAFAPTSARPMVGATALFKISTSVRETGIYNTSTSSWQNGTESVGSLSLISLEGDVTASLNFDSINSNVSINFADNANTFAEESQLSLGMPSTMTVAMSMTNGKVRVLSDVGMDSIIFDDSGFVFDDPNYASGGTPSITGSVTAGAFYIKNLAVWPFFTDSPGLQSLISYFS
jgi:hypothetical protein